MNKNDTNIHSIKYSGPSIIYSNLNIPLPSHENYGKFIVDKLLENQHKVALINGDTGDQITYGEMCQQVVNIASALIEMKVGADDVIGICSENRPEFLTTAIAGMCTEALVTFINCAYSKDEITHTLKISKPKYLFLSPNTFKTYYETIKKFDFISKYYVFGSLQSEGNLMSFADLASENKNIDTLQLKVFNGAEKTALILYSSGTTGLPKGAKLSHRNLIISGQPLSLKRNHTSLTIAPWTNTVGIMLTMTELIKGEAIVYMSRFNEQNYLKCIEKYKVGYVLAVPPLVVILSKSEFISKYDVSSVELIFCGGAPLSLSVIAEVKKRFPNLRNVLQGYGMTEASGGITNESDSEPRQGSVGKICDGLIIKVAPSELEAILQQHPGVKDTGVIGVPDVLAGELPTAFVVKQPEAAVTEKELMEFVKSKVSPWKQLRGGVRFLSEIPKNGSGKILRRKLREMLTKPISKL